jgi:hypothetical protein
MVRHCLMNRVNDSEHYHLRQIPLAEASRQDHRSEKSAALRPILALGRRVNDGGARDMLWRPGASR